MKDKTTDIKNSNQSEVLTMNPRKPSQHELEDIFRPEEIMSEQERQNMISVLELRTGYAFEYLNKLTNEQLNKLYKERVG